MNRSMPARRVEVASILMSLSSVKAKYPGLASSVRVSYLCACCYGDNSRFKLLTIGEILPVSKSIVKVGHTTVKPARAYGWHNLEVGHMLMSDA